MGWQSSREQISHTEAHQLGLTHVQPSDRVTATPSRKSVIVDGPGGPTGFTKTKAGWHAHTYDGYMAGQFQRRPDTEKVPYEQYLQDTRQTTFHDRRA